MKTEGHKHFLKDLERVMAGKKLRRKSGDAKDELLSLSAELMDARPEPQPRFVKQMDERVAALTGAHPDEFADIAAGAGKTGSQKFWSLPSWLTLPRLAAAMAVLVIGLGAVGLTTAIVSGEFGSFRQEVQGTSAPSAGSASSTGAASAGAFSTPGGATDLKDLSGENAGAPRSGSVSGTSGGTFPVTGDNISGAGADLPSAQRIVQTAMYEIEVPQGDFQTNYDRVNALAGKYGGYVVSAETRKSGDNQPLTGTISIRVSTVQDGFTRALAELDGMGTVLSREISGQDVTEEYVDLQSRLRNAEAQEAQLLTLMQKAQTIDEILMVQSRLSDIQSQIEQIKGRIKFMESRTDFATITVDLRESGATVTPTDNSATRWGFVDALEYAGWLAVQSVNFVIMVLGVIIPITLMGVLAFAGGRWLVRRRGHG